MARTNVRGSQINDGSVQRVDLDTTTTGQAVIRKVIAGTGISISQTGVDSGTGDVTVGLSVPVVIANGGTGQTTRQAAINSLTDASLASSGHVLTRDGSGNAIFSAIPYPVTSVFGRTGAVVAQSGDYTNAQVGLGNVTNDAQLKRAANDFNSFSSKATPVGGDILLVEDSADSGNKKYITLNSISHTLLTNIGTNTHAQIDSHIANTSNPHNTTASQVGLGNVTNDSQLKRAANDFISFSAKSVPVNADIILIEDSAASGVKKYSTINQILVNNAVTSFNGRVGAVVPQSGDYNNTQVGLGNVTNDAQLKRSANDFNTFTQKTVPVGADIFLIEDSAASGAKRYSTLTNISDRPLFNANRLQGFNVHTATPQADDLLVWNGTNSRWEPSSGAFGWQDWTPTLGTSGGGSFTSTTVNYARYRQFGKTVYFMISAVGSTSGNPSTITFSLPVTPTSGDVYGFGGTVLLGGNVHACAGRLDSTNGGLVRRDNNSALGNGTRTFHVQGFYEIP